MKDYLGAAKSYREHASELRKIARELNDRAYRTKLPTVADEYDQMARWAEIAGRLSERKSREDILGALKREASSAR